MAQDIYITAHKPFIYCHTNHSPHILQTIHLTSHILFTQYHTNRSSIITHTIHSVSHKPFVWHHTDHINLVSHNSITPNTTQTTDFVSDMIQLHLHLDIKHTNRTCGVWMTKKLLISTLAGITQPLVVSYKPSI